MNPQQVTWHIGYNIRHILPTELLTLFADFSVDYGALQVLFTVTMILAALLGAWTVGMSDQRLLPWLVLIAPPFISLLVQPLARHMLMFLPLLLILIGYGLLQSVRHSALLIRVISSAMGIIFVAGLFLLVRTTSFLPSQMAFPSYTPSISYIIPAIHQQASATTPIRLIAPYTRYATRVCLMASTRYCFPVEWPGGDDLAAFARHEHIHWLLIRLVNVEHDAFIQQLLASPESFSCVADPVTREGIQVIRCHPHLQIPPS